MKNCMHDAGILHLLHEKLGAGWKENLKNLSKHALLLGTSEYVEGGILFYMVYINRLYYTYYTF